MIMCGVGFATRKPHSCPNAWRRHVAIVIDGLRASTRLGAAALLVSGAMTAPETVTDPDLQEVAWDLSHLLNGAGDDPQAAVDALLGRGPGARRRVRRAATPARSPRWTAPGLIAAMKELGEIEEIAGRAGTYAHLVVLDRHRQPRLRRAAAARRGEGHRDRDRAAVLPPRVGGAGRRDAPRSCSRPTGWTSPATTSTTARRYRPHLLSEPEEKILTEKAVSGRSAWVRLFEEQTAAITVELPDEDEPASLEVALARLFEPDREVRRDTAERVTAALQPGLRTRAYTFNTLLADKMTDDRLRSYPHWLASRNLSNEASDESVQALIEAVRARYELPRRWYRLKAQLLGIDKLADYDRMAAVTQDNEKVGWTEAKGLVLDAYSSFSGDLGSLVQRFFDENWIDGPVRPGKRGGAFCSYGVPSVHPYVMLNYTYLRRDVLTLAHELGHGVHAALGSKQGVFHMATPLTLAETASVFGETLVFGRLLDAVAVAGVASCRCWRSRSRARSRPSSARWR